MIILLTFLLHVLRASVSNAFLLSFAITGGLERLKVPVTVSAMGPRGVVRHNHVIW